MDKCEEIDHPKNGNMLFDQRGHELHSCCCRFAMCCSDDVHDANTVVDVDKHIDNTG